MPGLIDIGKMLAGIAFILLAINFMEDSLRRLAGRKFKLVLKNQTNSKIKAIAGSAAVTALLQSSSIVNLLVLSMAGAGVVKMRNALALVLGANLGTTFNSWLVALVGFSFQIEDFALPIAGVTGIIMAFGKEERKWWLWVKFLFGLALLFIGLGFIKNGMEQVVMQTDLSAFTHFHIIIFLLMGILLTAIVQSGSVTIAITLTALHTNVIVLPDAMAIVLGSEIGTTLKLFVASAKGPAVKKRIATANFIINVITVGFLFILLRPIYQLLNSYLPSDNNVIVLVFFQTFINIISIILFYPFLNRLGNWLMKKYPESDDESYYIHKATVDDPELAADAFEQETKHFINLVIIYSLDAFNLKATTIIYKPVYKRFSSKTFGEKYLYIKHLHGEVHGFYLKLLPGTIDVQRIARMERLISSIRNAMYAAKSIWDARYDIEHTGNSSNNTKYGFYLRSAGQLKEINDTLLLMLNESGKGNHFEGLSMLYKKIITGYSITLSSLYKEPLAAKVDETEISTLINFNRELYTSYKSILFAAKDYLLSEKEGEYFEGQPGFIR
jgi:phosphate:Na+ symporter